jgi:hypothetical protein
VKKAIHIFLSVLIFIILTAITQIGGVIYLLHFFIYKKISHYTEKRWKQRLMKLACFVVPYFIATSVIIPPVAKLTGRVRLPVSSQALKPLSIWTVILNRNYVRPELLHAVVEVSKEVHMKNPGTCVLYLDANFPFIDGFPLLPHLSHNDGKKLDLAFFYEDAITHESITDAPSFVGYGICEEPAPGEVNTSLECAEKGYWQYSILRKIIPQGNKSKFQFNQEKRFRMKVPLGKFS